MSPQQRDGSTLRVVHVLTSTHRRGAEVFATELDAALQQRGVASRAVALRAAPDAAPSLSVPALADAQAGLGQVTRHLRDALRGADVAVAHGSRSLEAAALATAGLGVPFAYRVIGRPRSWARDPFRRAKVSVLLRRASAVVTYDVGAAAEVTQQYGVPVERLVTIPKGLDLTRYAPPDDQARHAARTACALTGPTLVALGALSHEKDLTLAIDAAAELGDVELVLVGDGPEAAALRAHASASGARVRFVGAVADPRHWLRAADAVLLTSTTEGVPGALLEAAACGTPSIALDVGGVDQVVMDGSTGRLVQQRNAAAIARAAREVLAQRAEMGRAARTRATTHFDLVPVAAAWHDLLARLAHR